MARSYELKTELIYLKSQQTNKVENTFNFKLMYEFLNGTKVIDYSKGQYEHPESNDTAKEESKDKSKQSSSGGGFIGVVINEAEPEKKKIEEKPFTMYVN